VQFAAALLEYLVSGFVALLWLAPLVQRLFGGTPPMSEASISLYLPVAYVLGIFVDATSSFLLDRFRGHRSSTSPYARTARILARAPEHVVKTMQAYAGRDRIARGVLLNAVIAVGVYAFVFAGTTRAVALSGAVVTVVWSALVWRRLDRLTSQFKEEVLKCLPPAG
jgi:hypothetical protein